MKKKDIENELGQKIPIFNGKKKFTRLIIDAIHYAKIKHPRTFPKVPNDSFYLPNYVVFKQVEEGCKRDVGFVVVANNKFESFAKSSPVISSIVEVGDMYRHIIDLKANEVSIYHAYRALGYISGKMAYRAKETGYYYLGKSGKPISSETANSIIDTTCSLLLNDDTHLHVDPISVLTEIRDVIYCTLKFGAAAISLVDPYSIEMYQND